MSNKYFTIVVTILLLTVVGCGLNIPKPGLGGKSNVRTIETSHPSTPEGVKCYVCHKNDRLEEEFHTNFSINCDECHRQTTWMAYDYPHEKWGLGAHKEMQCIKCHTEISTFNFSAYQCYDCHHEKEAIKNLHTARGMDDIDNCISCHKGSQKI